jgi:hypothetical protein
MEAGMTARIGAPRRLILIAAALLAAVTVVLAVGVFPPVRSDTYPEAAPKSAAAATRIQAVFAALLAIALLLVSALAAARPRAARATLHVIAAVAFLLGLVLAGPAASFVAHGPALRGAVILMYLSAAAELAAAVFMVKAASRLRRSASDRGVAQDVNEWKTRIAPAVLLGFGMFFLMFLLGEGINLHTAPPGEETIVGVIVAVALGAYSLLATYLLSRGLPRARRNGWIVLALNAVLLLSSILVLVVEDTVTGLQTLGMAVISIACSYVGLAWAARAAGAPEPTREG